MRKVNDKPAEAYTVTGNAYSENIKGKERFYLVQLRNGGGFYE
jgi:hypothetical protein